MELVVDVIDPPEGPPIVEGTVLEVVDPGKGCPIEVTTAAPSSAPVPVAQAEMRSTKRITRGIGSIVPLQA